MGYPKTLCLGIFFINQLDAAPGCVQWNIKRAVESTAGAFYSTHYFEIF